MPFDKRKGTGQTGGQVSAKDAKALALLQPATDPFIDEFSFMASTLSFSAEADAYTRFKTKYWSDPAGFIRDCIVWEAGEVPSYYQTEIAEALPKHRRVSIRGPHGLGKTSISAWIVLWFALTRDGKDWKLPTTASAWRQLTKFLWPEIHKWAGRLDWGKIGRGPFIEGKELLTLSMKLKTGEAFALASNQPALIEGAHADHILYIFDESKTIPAETWDAAEGAMSTGDAWWLCVSTPGGKVGRFYEIQARQAGYGDWFVRHVTVDEAIKAGRMDPAWVEARRTQWGETSPVFQNRVLGNFAEGSEDSIIPLSWVEQAIERWQDWKAEGVDFPFFGVGVDVARYGADSTILALRYGVVISELRRFRKQDTMQTTGNVVGVLSANPGGIAVVDVVGLGAGVVDRLRELGYKVDAFNSSTKTTRKDLSGELGFLNRRALAWWGMREALDPQTGIDLALPDDDELIGDLTAPQWRTTSSGLIRVEEKDEVKKRIGRSPDAGDAVVMVFCPEELIPPPPPKKRAGAWGTRR